MGRWLPIAVVGGGLFAINVASRLTMQLLGYEDPQEATVPSLVVAGIMAAVALGAGVWWSVRKSMDRIVSELGLGLLAASLLAVFLGPLTVGLNPVEGGASAVLIVLLTMLGMLVGAAFLGYLAATVLGVDYRSRNLKHVERHYGRSR